MEMVTKRDMDDAKGLGERSGLNISDDWDEFIHDVAQTIADGRRPEERRTLACGCVLGYERCIDCRPGLHLDQETALAMTMGRHAPAP